LWSAVDRCPLVGQQCVRSYNVQEAHGAIFLWFGVTADQSITFSSAYW
jgi:phenylpropionate dioxygenase-like ring-hydroxylating dioxygenase large terminal subunit